MLIEPASKVSVPLTVVRRTRSSVPERPILPAEKNCAFDPDVVPIEEDSHQVFPENKHMVAKPLYANAAPGELTTTKPLE